MIRLLSLLLCLAVSGFAAHAQFSKGDVILDLTGSYIESYNSSGVNISRYSSKIKTLDLAISMGYCFTNSFTAGFGIEYINTNELTNYEFYYPNAFTLLERLDSKANIFAPHIFFRYNKNITGKLFFQAELSSTYGFVSTNQESLQVGIRIYGNGVIDDNVLPGTFATGTETSDNSSLFNVALQPEFVYFLSDKIGLLLKIGGIQYNTDFDAHEWQITLNPSSWEYGFFLRVGKIQQL